MRDVLKYINEKVSDKTPITLLGASKGAEYILNLATKYKEIDNLILIAPSYTFAGLDFNDYGSSWTYKNKEHLLLILRKSSFKALINNMVIPMLIKSPVSYKETYESAIEKDPEKDNKLIPVKDTKANILIIVGEDSQMWGKSWNGKNYKSQSKNAEKVVFKNAGHILKETEYLILQIWELILEEL